MPDFGALIGLEQAEAMQMILGLAASGLESAFPQQSPSGKLGSLCGSVNETEVGVRLSGTAIRH